MDTWQQDTHIPTAHGAGCADKEIDNHRTSMILQAKGGCYLTQQADVPIEQRHFVKTVVIQKAGDFADWREVTEAEKEKMLQAGAVFDIKQLSPEYIDKIDAVLSAIPAHINEKHFTPAEALAHQEYYPVWGDVNASMGKKVETGFRFRYRMDESAPYTLYEVVTPHTLSADNPPVLPAMLLSASTDVGCDNAYSDTDGQVVYFIPVTAEVDGTDNNQENTNE